MKLLRGRKGLNFEFFRNAKAFTFFLLLTGVFGLAANFDPALKKQPHEVVYAAGWITRDSLGNNKYVARFEGIYNGEDFVYDLTVSELLYQTFNFNEYYILEASPYAINGSGWVKFRIYSYAVLAILSGIVSILIFWTSQPIPFDYYKRKK